MCSGIRSGGGSVVRCVKSGGPPCWVPFIISSSIFKAALCGSGTTPTSCSSVPSSVTGSQSLTKPGLLAGINTGTVETGAVHCFVGQGARQLPKLNSNARFIGTLPLNTSLQVTGLPNTSRVYRLHLTIRRHAAWLSARLRGAASSGRGCANRTRLPCRSSRTNLHDRARSRTPRR